MSELDQYRKYVERLAELDSTEVFSNAQTTHARIILETFFKFAKESVVIICHKLSSAVYGDQSFIAAVENALHRCVTVKILTQHPPEAEGFIAAIERWKAENRPIELRTAPQGSFISEGGANFAVMDKKGYRFEPERSDHKAFACMNDPILSAKLLRLFEKLELRVA